MIGLAIIGAGPYGLSLAAHLRSAGVSFRIYGRAMDAWASAMPHGMRLKSHAWSSNLSAPGEGFTLADYCHERGLAYDDALLPVSRELYVDYGRTFQQRFASELADKTLLRLEPVSGGFRLTFDDGEVVEARKVVAAIGISAFAHTPPLLAVLPASAVSHSADHGPLDGFAGRRVAVIGGGASAIELTALLRERGASPTLVARTRSLAFASPPASRLRSLFKRALRPNSGLGVGWYLRLCANAPEAFAALPGPLRRHLVRHTLGPLGGPGLRARLGDAPIHLGHRLDTVATEKDRIRISLRGGRTPVIEAEHIIAATGYRVDLGRLSFLPAELRARIRSVGGAPILSAAYQSSVAGLYFIGPIAANSVGPVARFVYGAEHAAAALARRFASERVRRSASASAALGAPAPSLQSRAR